MKGTLAASWLLLLLIAGWSSASPRRSPKELEHIFQLQNSVEFATAKRILPLAPKKVEYPSIIPMPKARPDAGKKMALQIPKVEKKILPLPSTKPVRSPAVPLPKSETEKVKISLDNRKNVPVAPKNAISLPKTRKNVPVAPKNAISLPKVRAETHKKMVPLAKQISKVEKKTLPLPSTKPVRAPFVRLPKSEAGNVKNLAGSKKTVAVPSKKTVAVPKSPANKIKISLAEKNVEPKPKLSLLMPHRPTEEKAVGNGGKVKLILKEKKVEALKALKKDVKKMEKDSDVESSSEEEE